jgi:dihydroorotate dehydrogenase (NAD+) catalytic subunit
MRIDEAGTAFVRTSLKHGGWMSRTVSKRDFLDLRDRLLPVTPPQPVPAPTRSPQVDLSVNVGALSLKNPVIAASGTFGYGIEFAELVDLNRLGGIVVKGLSIEPMAGSAAPRMCDTTSGIVNAIGLQNIGVRAFVAEKLPLLRRYNTRVIANVFGTTVAGYLDVIRVLEESEGVDGYELNVSCPNVEKGGVEFGTDPDALSQVVKAARRLTARPLWVKLVPTVGFIGVMAKAAEGGGADGLTIANTYPALCVDVHNRKSRLGSTTGGLSGAAIRPITVRLVYEACKAVRIPVVGLGGIETPEDAVEYILSGASAVEVGTAHFIDPRASERLVTGLKKWCEANNIYQLSDLRGGLTAFSGLSEQARS